LLAIAGAVIILTGHWATTDDMIADGRSPEGGRLPPGRMRSRSMTAVNGSPVSPQQFLYCSFIGSPTTTNGAQNFG
jgi:hypothetical protein